MVYDHGTYYGGFVDHVLGRDYAIKSDTLSLQTENSSRRFQRWIKHSLVYQIITWVPFHIVDFFLNELEYKHGCDCPWCGRLYFRFSKNELRKLKDCCSDTKRNLVRNRVVWQFLVVIAMAELCMIASMIVIATVAVGRIREMIDGRGGC